LVSSQLANDRQNIIPFSKPYYFLFLKNDKKRKISIQFLLFFSSTDTQQGLFMERTMERQLRIKKAAKEREEAGMPPLQSLLFKIELN
jgi:hypothetical protein